MHTTLACCGHCYITEKICGERLCRKQWPDCQFTDKVKNDSFIFLIIHSRIFIECLPATEESWTPKNWCFWTVVLEKTLESPLDCKEIQPVHSEDQPWDFFGRNDAEAETLATSCEELTHWKRLWCWEGLGAGGERDDRGWDGWMASLTRWTWVWVNSWSW